MSESVFKVKFFVDVFFVWCSKVSTPQAVHWRFRT